MFIGVGKLDADPLELVMDFKESGHDSRIKENPLQLDDEGHGLFVGERGLVNPVAYEGRRIRPAKAMILPERGISRPLRFLG